MHLVCTCVYTQPASDEFRSICVIVLTQIGLQWLHPRVLCEFEQVFLPVCEPLFSRRDSGRILEVEPFVMHDSSNYKCYVKDLAKNF